MYFQGGRHVKKFHLKFHFLGGGWVCRGRRGQWGRSVVSPRSKTEHFPYGKRGLGPETLEIFKGSDLYPAPQKIHLSPSFRLLSHGRDPILYFLEWGTLQTCLNFQQF